MDLYARWTQQTTAAELSSLLGRPVEWLAGAARYALRLTVDSRSLAIRVPLGRAGGSALCFWLDLLRRSVRSSPQVPSFFWSHDGEAGDAVMCLGVPGESTLAALWLNELAEPRFLDLLHRDASPPQPFPSGLGDRSVASFLDAIESLAGAAGVRP